MFLNDDRVVFSLVMILFTFSRFIFCSCDSVSSRLLSSASFGSVVFSFSKVGCSFLFLLDTSSCVWYCIIILFMCFLMDF